MSKEYIDKDEFYDVIDGGYDLNFDELPESKAAMLEMIRNFDPADVKPVVRGEWIETVQPCGWHEIRCATCSKCGEDYPLGDGEFRDVVECWRFCPNCGAEMRKEAKE